MQFSEYPTLRIKFRRLTDDGWLPTKANPSDLGFDLRSTANYQLLPGEVTKIPTRIACGFPEGYGGLILDRSSMASRGLKVVGGVIDNGYTGELIVCIINLNSTQAVLQPGDKIAQLVLLASPQVAIIEVAELGNTDRGDKGFGSSGK